MTVLIAKVISRISAPLSWYDVGTMPMPVASRHSILAKFAIKKEYLAGAFLIFAALSAVAYIVTMNVIIFEGAKLPSLQATLKDLEHEQKLKYASFTAIRSPLALKKEAIDGMKMVEVKNVQYLDSNESVAANILRVP